MIGVVVLVLGAIFALNKSKEATLETKLENEKLATKDAVLQEQQKQNDRVISQEQQKIDGTPPPKAEDLDNKQIKDFWNKK